MAEGSPPAQQASGAGGILRSPDGRLRSGWRLILHAVLMIAVSLVIGVPFLFIQVIVSGLDPDRIEVGSATLAVIPVVGITLATWIARRRLDRRSFISLGLKLDRWTLLDLVAGFTMPALMMGLIYLIESGLGWLTFEGWAWETVPVSTLLPGFVSALLAYVAVGYYEELMGRGYQLQNLIDSLGLRWGFLVSSAIFGVLHLGNPDAGLASTLGILAAGLFLAFAWYRTGQLWLPIGLHIGWNFFEGTVFGFPVSGLGGVHLIDQSVVGPELITGGPFGPEAGLILLPAIGLGTVLVWGYTQFRQDAAEVRTGGGELQKRASEK